MMRGRLAFCLLALCLVPLQQAVAQIRTVPKELLDSIANPAVAENSSLMEFDTRRIVAAGIGEDELPVYSYDFVNRGDKPIVVNRITTSCGCAVAECASRVTGPGERGTISVTYHPKGHPGRFERRIFVYTNLSSERPTAVLSLDVTVRAGEDRSRWFPHQMGRIRMKVKEFAFRQDVKDVVCLAFLNAGDVPVTPVPDTAMLPSYLKAWCETPGVEPGKEGEICIAFDPDKFREQAVANSGWLSGASSRDVSRTAVVLGGVGATPREAAIIITIQ